MSRSYENTMAELRTCETDPADPKTSDRLRAGLGHRSNLVVRRAANLVTEQRRSDLMEDLVENYPRFLHDPSKTDPGCDAKTAIVDALLNMHLDDHPFLKE